VRTIHAEINAIAQAAKTGMAIKGAVIYTTVSPCWECFKVLANAGIRQILYKEKYNFDERINIAIRNNNHWSFKTLDIEVMYLGDLYD
jgi:deoxycytidylate deaminase